MNWDKEDKRHMAKMVNKDEYPGLGKALVPQKWTAGQGHAEPSHFPGPERPCFGSSIKHMARARWRHAASCCTLRWGDFLTYCFKLPCSFPPIISFLSQPSLMNLEYKFFYCSSFLFSLHCWEVHLITDKSWPRERFPETRWSQPGRVLEARNGMWISKLLVLTKCLLNLLTSLLSPMTPSA